MRILEADKRLNLFRFVGRTKYWEDNVTRALLCVLTRSGAKEQLLRNLLDRCASRIEPRGTALAKRLTRALRSVREVEVDFQQVARGVAEDGRLSLLVLLTPAPQSRANPELDAAAEAELYGRFDAVLECRTEESVVEVVIEAKLHGEVGAEQESRYCALRGRDRCEVVSLPWSEVLDVIDQVSPHDTLITDFADYVSDMHWLSGFRGLRASDLSNPDDEGARGRFGQLMAGVKGLGSEQNGGVVYSRTLKQNLDCDFYLEDQFNLVGNTGIALWSPGPPRVKLVIGNFRFLCDDEDVRQRIVRRCGRETPAAEGFQGLRKTLVNVDAGRMASLVLGLASDMQVKADVVFRLFFGQGDETVWLNSREVDVLSASDWMRIDAALRLGEPAGGMKVVSEESVAELRDFVDEGELEGALFRVRQLLGRNRSRRPSHHAHLCLTAAVPECELLRMSPPQQLLRIAHVHRRIAQVLRAVSVEAAP